MTTEYPCGSWRLYCAIARQAFHNVYRAGEDVGDLVAVRDEMKWLCAMARVDYEGDIVHRAVEHVAVSRRIAAGATRPWSWWICLCGTRTRTTAARCRTCGRGRAARAS